MESRLHTDAALSDDDARDLDRLETKIAKGLQTFVEVGEALAEIRDRKLYRNEHATFDAYLETKWKISRSWACRQINAAETVKLLPTGNKPTTERQARELNKLPPSKRAEAWQEAVETSPTGTPTAKAVAAVVAQRTGTPAKAEDEKTPLQWVTYWWPFTSEADRKMFDNFRAGMGAAR